MGRTGPWIKSRKSLEKMEMALDAGSKRQCIESERGLDTLGLCHDNEYNKYRHIGPFLGVGSEQPDIKSLAPF